MASLYWVLLTGNLEMNMYDVKRFKEDFEFDLVTARNSVAELESMIFRGIPYTDPDYSSEEERLESLLDQMYLKLCFALEIAGANQALEELRRRWRKQLKLGLTHMRVNSSGDYAYSTGLDVLEKISQALFAATGIGDIERAKHDLLVQLLEQTAAIVEFQKIAPANEADVKRTIHSHLRFVFPDIGREIPISKPSKTYKPDFGVRSLKAAIEYKFADSEAEAKKTLGEVYEDIHGYSGSLDWTEFYFVMYQTGNYITKHVIEAEWKLSDPHKRWHPIVVVGTGTRKGLPVSKGEVGIRKKLPASKKRP